MYRRILIILFRQHYTFHHFTMCQRPFIVTKENPRDALHISSTPENSHPDSVLDLFQTDSELWTITACTWFRYSYIWFQCRRNIYHACPHRLGRRRTAKQVQDDAFPVKKRLRLQSAHRWSHCPSPYPSSRDYRWSQLLGECFRLSNSSIAQINYLHVSEEDTSFLKPTAT